MNSLYICFKSAKYSVDYAAPEPNHVATGYLKSIKAQYVAAPQFPLSQTWQVSAEMQFEGIAYDTSISVSFWSTENLTAISNESYNRPSSNETGVVTTFQYDVSNRLATSTDGAVSTYTYDDNGNLIGVNTAGTLTTMAYDKESRLSKHDQTTSPNVATYMYGPDGLKRLEHVDSVASTLIWDGTDNVSGRS